MDQRLELTLQYKFSTYPLILLFIISEYSSNNQDIIRKAFPDGLLPNFFSSIIYFSLFIKKFGSTSLNLFQVIPSYIEILCENCVLIISHDSLIIMSKTNRGAEIQSWRKHNLHIILKIVSVHLMDFFRTIFTTYREKI